LNLKFQLHNHGFEIHEQACPPALLARLRAEFPGDSVDDGELMAHSDTVRQEAVSGCFYQIAAEVLGSGCFPLQAILETKNELVQPWHQDQVADQGSYDGLLSVRLYLDDCSFFDGALKLCPSSHKHGLLTAQEIRGHSLRPFSSPEMKAGDVLLMHPLTIHAYAASGTANSRRVIQIDYAASAS